MKVTAKRVYEIVTEALSPHLTGAGFRRAKGVSLGWTKTEGDRTLSLWFQCDKNGWSEDWGSQFTCELQSAHAPEIGANEFGGRFRYSHLLTEGELEDLRKRNNRIIQSLPGYVGGRTVVVKDAEGVECVVVGHRPSTVPYHPGWDTWMHYHSEHDVSGWGRYLDERIEGFLERVRARAT